MSEGEKGRLRRVWDKVWFVLWKDDSPLSIAISFVVAYLLIQFVFYPGLGMLLGTDYPVVAVISGSMEHRANAVCSDNIAGGIINRDCTPREATPRICGVGVNETGYVDLDEYWSLCGDWYEARGIGKTAFETFPLSNGFNTGDIMVLRAADDIEIGDVIVFQTLRDTPIIHRVIDIQRTDRGIVYSTKGDYNAGQLIDYENTPLGRVPVIDERQVSEAQVIGEASFRIPWLGYPKLWLTNVIGWFR